jgi:HSP20 family protein
MTLLRTRRPNYPTFTDRFLESDLLDFFNANFSETNTTLPAVNVKETDDEFKVELAAPGMKKEDFNISLENDQLTVSSEHKKEAKDEDNKYSRREFSYQAFQRTFSIPENRVDNDKIDAKYDDGILHIRLPKLEHAKTKSSRTIEVK